MKQVLLDTNAYSQLLRGDRTVLEVLAAAEIVYMSIFVLGELLAGFRGGKHQRENEKRLDAFLHKSSVKILNATRETAALFGEIKQGLKEKGAPIPINDVWIAAHAVETGSVLITFDPHFEKIPAVRLWDHHV